MKPEEWNFIKEKGYLNNKSIIECRKKYFRPSDVENLRGNYNKAKKILGWKSKVKFEDLVKEMVESDLKNVKDKVY